MTRLRLELRPSPAFAGALVIAHAAAGACVLLVLPAPAGLALAAGLLALGTLAAWQRALLHGASAVRAIEIEDASHAVFQLGDGTRRQVELAARRYVTRWLVTVPVRGPGGRTLAVTAGMLEAEAFRALRLWALWGRVRGVAAVQLPA